MSVRFTPALRHLFLAGALLLSAGARAQVLDAAFPPVHITKQLNGVAWPAYIAEVVRQPDGKYLVGGDFQTLNGVPTLNLARLLPNGTVDASFTAPADGPVNALVLQPDGQILVGGSFQNLGGSPRRGLARLRADGTVDPGFVPPLSPPAVVGSLVRQPDGKVLATGRLSVPATGPAEQYILRFDGASGQYDPSFQFTLPTADSYPTRLLLQPDGKVLVGGAVPAYRQAFMLMRLQANGAADASFAAVTNRFSGGIQGLALDGAGRIYAAGLYNGMPGGSAALRRYQPDGSDDFSFNHAFLLQNYGANAVALQPNGRVLVGNATIYRVLADGTPDASYNSAPGPVGNTSTGIRRLLVDPDGAILVAGSFSVPGSTGQIGLVRLLDANVLALKPRAAGPLSAWPVPASEVLHLRLESGTRARQVQLLDALGRVVRTYPSPAAPELNLSVSGLPAGTYQLQAELADGRRAVQRVLVQ